MNKTGSADRPTAGAGDTRQPEGRRTRRRLLFARQALMERLAHSPRRIVVLDAPAGFGKTSLLLAWQRALVATGTDVAWLSLPSTATPAPCTASLLAAFSMVDSAIVGQARREAAGGESEAQLERTVIALVRGLIAHARPVVLVVDDAQHAGSAGSAGDADTAVDGRVRQIFRLLVEYAPPHLRFAFATRGGVLPLSLARERAQGQVLDFGLEDLRFSRAETEHYLHERMARVDAHMAGALHELSEGWGELLHLLAAHWRPRKGAAAQGIGGLEDLAAVAAFFDAQVFASWPAAEMRALQAWSAASQLCASLCAALAPPGTARGTVAGTLQRMAAAGLLAPAGPATGTAWAHMHPLVRMLLQLRLQAGPHEECQRVHTSAWLWFASQDMPQEAVRHALLADDVEAASQLVEHAVRPLFAKGDIRALVSLVRQLPDSARMTRPALRFWSAWIALSERRFDECEQIIQDLEAESAGQAAMLFRLNLLRSLAASLHGDVATVLRHQGTLLAPPADADPIALAGSRNVLSWLFLHRGEHARARAIQLDAPPAIVDGQPFAGTVFGSLMGRTLVGLSHAVQGDMHAAEEHYRAVLAEAADRGNCIEAAALAQQLLMDVTYERQGPQEAARQSAEHPVGPGDMPLIADAPLRIALITGRGHLSAGHTREALQVIAQALDAARALQLDREAAYLLLDAMKIHLAEGDTAAAGQALHQIEQLAQAQGAPARLASGDIQMLVERGQVLMAMHDGRLGEARARLEALIAQASNRGLHRRLVYLLVQAAGVARDQRDPAAASSFVHAALPLAHRLGLMQVLLEAHPRARMLLREAARAPGLDDRLVFHAERIEALARRQEADNATQGLQGLQAVAASASTASLTEQLSGEVAALLTPREAEVVALLRQGMPNKRIARALGLSLDTVKWHLKNVFLKLNVHGREGVAVRLGEPPGQSSSN